MRRLELAWRTLLLIAIVAVSIAVDAFTRRPTRDLRWHRLDEQET